MFLRDLTKFGTFLPPACGEYTGLYPHTDSEGCSMLCGGWTASSSPVFLSFVRLESECGSIVFLFCAAYHEGILKTKPLFIPLLCPPFKPSPTSSLSFSSAPTFSFPFQPPHYPHKKTKPKPNVHSNYLYLRVIERTFTARVHRKDEKLGNRCLAIAVMWPPGETKKKKIKIKNKRHQENMSPQIRSDHLWECLA